MNICIRNKGLITGNIRNRGNKELSEQSNCSVLQGTEVGSDKKHDQYILIPQRVIQQVSALFSKQGWQISRKLSILQQISTFPSSMYIFNKHPRQSWSKDCSPGVYQTFSSVTSPDTSQNFPRRVQSSFPRKVGIHLPKQKAYPRRARTRLPALFKELFP